MLLTQLLNLFAGLWWAACLLSPTAAETLTVVPRSQSDVAGLSISHPRLPGNTLVFGTCEAVLDGNQDFGLFQVKLALPPTDNSPAWHIDGGTMSYKWRYPAGIEVSFRGQPQDDALHCTYVITNSGQQVLERVHLHTCVTTTEAPAFFPAANQAVNTNAELLPSVDYTELYERVFLWSNGKPFRFAESEYGRKEMHVAFMRSRASPIQWAWWVNSKRTFDTPLIAVASRDGRFTTALWFESAIWASCNVGDERACFHLFPFFGRLLPGQSATVKGKLALAAATPAEIYQRVAVNDDMRSEPIQKDK